MAVQTAGEVMQHLGIVDGQIVLLPVSPTVIDLAGHLAWPLAAVLIAMLLKKHLLRLSEGALAFKAFVEDKGKLAGLMAQLSETSRQVSTTQSDVTKVFEGLEDKLEKLQTNLNLLRDGVRNLEEQEGDHLKVSLEKSIADSGTVAPRISASVPTDIDEKWSGILSAWNDIKTALKNRMDKAGIKGSFQGTSNISSVVNGLKDAQQISEKDADLIMSLAKRYSWMYRTTVPQEEFLTRDAYADFLTGAAAVKEALG